MVVFKWNGTDVPTELGLRPGRSVVEPLDSTAPLTEDEDAGLRGALLSLQRGEGVDEDELHAQARAKLIACCP